MEFIRGEDREQILLLPESIEEYVEENGTVRVIDAYVENLDLQELGLKRWETKETLCADSFTITADKGYASASDVASAMQIGVALHVAGVECDICIPVKGEQPPEMNLPEASLGVSKISH